MDIVSHGLWGGIVFGRKRKKLYWWAFGFGVVPDLLSFGIYTGANILELASGPEWGRGLPDPAAIPAFVHMLYNFSHSLVIFSLVFSVIWFFRQKPFISMLAWGLHILVDIPTHSAAFFPTPFLWPISDFMINGIGWGRPIIFFPNIILLAAAYLYWWANRRRNKIKNNNIA